MAAQVNINDPKNYKSCRKKQYEIWVCKPPVGTVVINKLEQAHIVSALNGATCFSTVALERFRQAGNPLYQQLMQYAQQGLVYVAKEQDVVLSGTRGEFWVTSIEKVKRTYQVMLNGQWGSDWARATQSRGETVNGQFVLPWMKIRSMGDAASATMACFVPQAQVGQIRTSWAVLNYNAPDVEHGLGDFILCSKCADGSPDLNNRWVVNGAVFADTYNNQGWANCLKTAGATVSAPEPQSLYVSHGQASKLVSRYMKQFDAEFKSRKKSYKLSSKPEDSGTAVLYKVEAANGKYVQFKVGLAANDDACKSVKMSFSSTSWNISLDFPATGANPMRRLAVYVWGILHEDCGLPRDVVWTAKSVTNSVNEAVVHNLEARGFSITHFGRAIGDNYTVLAYEIARPSQNITGIKLKLRVALTTADKLKITHQCRFRDDFEDTESTDIHNIQESAEAIVTESLIGAGFPFDD